MGRRPIKKRVARKSVKRPTFDQIIKKTLAKKVVPTNPKFNLKIGSDQDRFFVHPETIPAGVALQWTSQDVPEYHTESMLDRCLASGWKPVKNCKPIHGLVLVWAPKAIADAQRDLNIKRAQDQMRDAKELFGMMGGGASPFHGSIKIVDQSWIVANRYESVPSDSPPIDIDITIKFRMSARWQDAAAALGLEVQEYARRRLIMEDIILASYGGIDKVYEPVELQITRKDF